MDDDLIRRVEAAYAQVAAPFVRQLALRVVSASKDATTLAMPITPNLVHGGGVLCGQAMLAAADTAMVLALSAWFGEFRPMTTVQLQTSFLRPVPGDAGDAIITCRILRCGKSLAFGEVDLALPDGKLFAHATTTYALIGGRGSAG
ncbi:MAG: PaaI family thioesterase [Burkholderiaceae bacterium]|jgi:uncharacterized protein (TIGR00369 family)|nr:PaaI family thioesterase [Burkholderiaceae bacterium]